VKKDNIDIETTQIDFYYNELFEKDINLDLNIDSININDKLNAVSEKLDSLNNIDFDLDVNILSIIQSAENIKIKKKNNFETLSFVLTELLILSLFSSLGILSGFKVLIYILAFTSILLPFILIPLAQIYKNKEGIQ